MDLDGTVFNLILFYLCIREFQGASGVSNLFQEASWTFRWSSRGFRGIPEMFQVVSMGIPWYFRAFQRRSRSVPRVFQGALGGGGGCG